MRRTRERGEGNISTLIFFVLLGAAGLAAWNLVPVYYSHYDFTDKVEEICRTPAYKARTNEIIMGMLMKEVSAAKLDDYIGPRNFEIRTSNNYRQILLYYEREVQVLPGWKRTLKFEYTADQPLL